MSEFQSFRLSGVFDCLGIFIYGVAQAAALLEISRVPIITASLVCRNQLRFTQNILYLKAICEN